MEEFEKINSKIKNYLDGDMHEIYEETVRIADYAVRIARSEMINKEDVELLYLIATLTDLGKITDSNTITILFDEGKIRQFSDDSNNDDIIRDVIYAISKRTVPEFYDDKSKKFINIINDSITLNKFYKLANSQLIIDPEEKINKNILNYFTNFKVCQRSDIHSNIDAVVFTMSRIFNFNYKYSLYEIEKEQILEKINDNLNFQNEMLINLFDQLKKIIMKYIKMRIGEAYHGW